MKSYEAFIWIALALLRVTVLQFLWIMLSGGMSILSSKRASLSLQTTVGRSPSLWRTSHAKMLSLEMGENVFKLGSSDSGGIRDNSSNVDNWNVGKRYSVGGSPGHNSKLSSLDSDEVRIHDDTGNSQAGSSCISDVKTRGNRTYTNINNINSSDCLGITGTNKHGSSLQSDSRSYSSTSSTGIAEKADVTVSGNKQVEWRRPKHLQLSLPGEVGSFKESEGQSELQVDERLSSHTPPGCSEYWNHDYKGFLCGGMNTIHTTTQSSWRSCHKACGAAWNCQNFTYRESDGKCYFKNGDKGCLQSRPGYVAGFGQWSVAKCASCEVEEWSSWSDCSKICHKGIQSRNRKSTWYAYKGAPMKGDEELCKLEESKDCNVNIPCDCKVSDWSAWTTCSVICDAAIQTRTREITEEAIMMDCSSSLLDKRGCGESPCQTRTPTMCTKPPCASGCNETLIANNTTAYRGCQFISRSGHRCVDWSSPLVNKSEYLQFIAEKSAVGTHNYCRNPSNRRSTIWCYISQDIDTSNIFTGNISSTHVAHYPTIDEDKAQPSGYGSTWDYCDPAEFNGTVSMWSEWTSCSVTCGQGIRYRDRTLTNPTIGVGIPPLLDESEECNDRSCRKNVSNNDDLNKRGEDNAYSPFTKLPHKCVE